jgi:RecA/RadA recombinase
MAKKKGKFSFNDIVGLTDGLIKKTAITRETLKTAQQRTMLGTGIYVLNAAISGDIYGGIPDNRISVFAGESGVGKSFLCFNICRKAQEEGYSIIYIDTEFAIELDQLPNYGIDISEDKFMLIRNNVIEDLKIFTTQLLDNLKEQKDAGNEIDKFLIVLDSVGQLGSRKEVEDAKSGKEKADFTKSKAIASYFRIINSDIGYAWYTVFTYKSYI